MVDDKITGKVAEEIVLQMLKKEGKKVIDNRKNPKKFGDFQVGNTIIEVKGQNEDHTGGKFDNFDFVTRYITLSDIEWNFLKKNPNQFEVYIVYRLNEVHYPDHPEWNYPKIIRIKGTELKGRDTNQPMIRVKTLKPFWSDKGKNNTVYLKPFLRKQRKNIKNDQIKNSDACLPSSVISIQRVLPILFTLTNPHCPSSAEIMFLSKLANVA